MNNLEAWLGVFISLFSVLSIVFVFSGVVPSPWYPGEYTFGFPSGLAEVFLILSIPVGFVVVGHGVRRNRLLEVVLGFLIVVWGYLGWS